MRRIKGPWIAERILYHQIHPMKLFTDWATGLLALCFLWRHRLGLSLVVALLPSIVVSGALVRWADLEPRKNSRFGRYIARHMTREMETVRLLGYAVMAIGAWFRRPLLLPIGLLVIVFGWLNGKLFGAGV